MSSSSLSLHTPSTPSFSIRRMLRRGAEIRRELGYAQRRTFEMRTGVDTGTGVQNARNQIHELEALHRLPAAGFGGRVPNRSR